MDGQVLILEQRSLNFISGDGELVRRAAPVRRAERSAQDVQSLAGGGIDD